MNKKLCALGLAVSLIFGNTMSVQAKDPVGIESVTDYDIRLIAVVTMAEAEGESEEGKRLVIDTILNRVDSEHFPNTIEGVIYQRGQFSCMWDGRINQCYVQDDICRLVREELEDRMEYECIYFRTKRYSSSGTPMYKVGHHYFSSYD
jgi:N-acetylmuramoyl-L-alanine amidase